MSFEVNWEEIRKPASLDALQATLNEHLKNIPTHGLVEQLTIQELWLGETPPELALEDILDGPTPEDTRLVLRIRYSSPINALLRGDLVINHPAPRFAVLPVRICIKQVNIDGVLLVDYIGTSVTISLRKEKESDFTFDFDSEIGDPSRHSKPGPGFYYNILGLKNVGKVESFVRSMVSKIIEMLLISPNYIQFKIDATSVE
jgi:hypothetical protein